MCQAILKAVDVIKKGREELNSYLACGRGTQGGSGEGSARFPTTEPLQALYHISEMKAQYEDMCQEDDDWHWQEDQDLHWGSWQGPWDSVCDPTTGQALDMRKVKAGRNEELDWMRKMHVWDHVPRSEVVQAGHKIVGTRWVYVDKGDQVRCRLVAQEFAGRDKREDLYAGTPPIAATRYLLSNTVSRYRKFGKPLSRKLMVLDIRRAFLHGIATRLIHVELPEEESEGGKYVGRLVKTLYGTRDAPVAWQKVVKDEMFRLGFH